MRCELLRVTILDTILKFLVPKCRPFHPRCEHSFFLCTLICVLRVRHEQAPWGKLQTTVAEHKTFGMAMDQVHPNCVFLDYTRFCIESTTKTTHTHTSKYRKNSKSCFKSTVDCVPSTAVRWHGGLRENQSGKHLPPWSAKQLYLSDWQQYQQCNGASCSSSHPHSTSHTHTHTTANSHSIGEANNIAPAGLTGPAHRQHWKLVQMGSLKACALLVMAFPNIFNRSGRDGGCETTGDITDVWLVINREEVDQVESFKHPHLPGCR